MGNNVGVGTDSEGVGMSIFGRRKATKDEEIGETDCHQSEPTATHHAGANVVFSCPSCGRQCFDGNMPKVAQCVCGERWLRDDFGVIARAAEGPHGDSFEDGFSLCTTQFQGFLKDLELVSFGVFTDHLQTDTSGVLFQSELHNLREFFTVRKRFLSEGERFQYLGRRYKVMSAYPCQGFVGARTGVSCVSVLTFEEVQEVHLAAVSPHVLTPDLQNALVHPYFAESRHLHSQQALNLRGLECIVLSMTPADGLTTASTRVTFEPEPLPTIKTLRVTPYLEDLPPDIQRLDRLTNMKAVFARYLTPFFKGWRRVITHGEALNIRGAVFRVNLARPTRGVVAESTTILYHGKAASRRQEMEKQMQQDEALARSLQFDPHRAQRLSRSRETRDMLLQVIEMLHVIRVSTDSEGASPLDIDLLPTHKFTKASDNENCLICLCEFQTDDILRTLPCCKSYAVHYFHSDCIDKWLVANKTCPVCKTPSNIRAEDLN